MIYEKKNFSMRPPACKSGDEFVMCNFSQLEPNTEVFAGKKNLKFTRCNMVNCKPPKGAVVEQCNTAQIDFCSHNRPELAERGLVRCAAICRHRKLNSYEDKIVSQKPTYAAAEL